jgi:hypothetical protein
MLSSVILHTHRGTPVRANGGQNGPDQSGGFDLRMELFKDTVDAPRNAIRDPSKVEKLLGTQK